MAEYKKPNTAVQNNCTATDRTIRPHYLGHRKRLKEKYFASGMEGWHDYEALEFALTFVIRRKDTKSTAKKLLSKFKSLNGVINADVKELETVNGISKHSSFFLRFLRDFSRFYSKKEVIGRDIISSPKEAVDYLRVLLRDCPDEEFHTLFVDSRNRLIASENIHKGTVNKSVVYPKKIVERAIYHHCAGLILAHNHPGGTQKPSEEDIESTKAINNALQTVDIALLDHIIIAGNNYFSWKENDLIK